MISKLPSLAAVTKLGASADISQRYLPLVLRFTLCRNTDFLLDLRIYFFDDNKNQMIKKTKKSNFENQINYINIDAGHF